MHSTSPMLSSTKRIPISGASSSLPLPAEEMGKFLSMRNPPFLFWLLSRAIARLSFTLTGALGSPCSECSGPVLYQQSSTSCASLLIHSHRFVFLKEHQHFPPVGKVSVLQRNSISWFILTSSPSYEFSPPSLVFQCIHKVHKFQRFSHNKLLQLNSICAHGFLRVEILLFSYFHFFQQCGLRWSCQVFLIHFNNDSDSIWFDFPLKSFMGAQKLYN